MGAKKINERFFALATNHDINFWVRRNILIDGCGEVLAADDC
jgi:hypothetical protein